MMRQRLSRERAGTRRVALALTAAAGTMLALASVVLACTGQASMSLDRQAAPAGAVVNGTGQGFFSPVWGGGQIQVHLSATDGTLLWQGLPGPSGNVAFSFQVPQVGPGYYTVVGYQTSPTDGSIDAGTVVRASLQVLAQPVQSPAFVPAAGPGPAPIGSSGAGSSSGSTAATGIPPGVKPAPVLRPASTAPAVSGQGPAQSLGRSGFVPAPRGTGAFLGQTSPGPLGTGPVSGGSSDVPALAPVAWPRQAAQGAPVSMSTNPGNPSAAPWLALGTVGVGLMVTLAAGGMLVAQRGVAGAPAKLTY